MRVPSFVVIEPNMNHFLVVVDAETGQWDRASIEYVGSVDRTAWLAKIGHDTPGEHFDTCPNAGTFERLLETSPVELEEHEEVALTVVWGASPLPCRPFDYRAVLDPSWPNCRDC